jgi:cation transport ATPase
MRNILLLLLLCSVYSGTSAQVKILKDTIQVSGNCGSCKERIEEAVYKMKGVKSASWNKNTKLLYITYNSTKNSTKDLQLAIAAVGHDANNTKASDSVYEALPSCCKYRNGKTCND